MEAGENVWTTNGPHGRYITALALDPTNPFLVYSGGWGYPGVSVSSAFRTLDGGASWWTLAEVPPGETITALVVSPKDPSVVYAATKRYVPPGPVVSAVYKSLDAGVNWIRLISFRERQLFDLAVDPESPNIVYAAGASFVCPTGDCQQGGLSSALVLKSSNGGRGWVESSEGLDGAWLKTLLIDPFAPARVYVGGDQGVFKSTSAGRQWHPIRHGLVGDQVNDLALTPTTPTTLYAAKGNLVKPSVAGVWKSIDEGATWEPTALTEVVFSIVVDASNPEVLWAGTVQATGILGPMGTPGVFRSLDGGRRWSLRTLGLRENGVNKLVIDPTGTTIYAGTGDGVFQYTIVPGGRARLVPVSPRSGPRPLPPRN